MNRTVISFSSILLLLVVTASALAMWSDTLKISATVETGEVDVEFGDYSCIEGDEYGKPWVADCSVTLDEVEDEDPNNPTGNNDLDLIVTISNAYPGYSCVVKFTVVNVGTIPVIGPFYELPEIPDGLIVVFEPGLSQIDPGDEVEYTIYLEVLQVAEEGATYEVQIHLRYIQWNEVEGMYATISGYVFNDVNENGVWDAGEEPLPGVHIELLDDLGNIVGTDTTRSDGYYEFRIYTLMWRHYTVVATALPGYYFTTPYVILVSVGPGSSNTNNNFGLAMSPPKLTVSKEFRHTDTNFGVCPAYLGSPLDSIKVILQGGKVQAVAPRTFFGIIWISGSGITQIEITDTYDFHFDVVDGQDGKVRVYILGTDGCVRTLKEGKNFTYTVDNEGNVVAVSITLSQPLRQGESVLVYLKFKPSDELLGSKWDSLKDKSFDNEAYITTNIGSGVAKASINIGTSTSE